jgi:redox-sensing transcriptional repressor
MLLPRLRKISSLLPNGFSGILPFLDRPMNKASKIPDATIERLAMYSRPLEALQHNGSLVVSSKQLAAMCGVNPAQVRKDLAYFGEFGVRGVGYEIRDLLREIKRILATDREWKLCIAGLGNLGSALVQNENFRQRGYNFVAAFDSSPGNIGRTLPSGLVVEPFSRVKEVVSSLRVEIGVITTSPSEAKRIAGILMDSGVRALLNFAPVQIRSRSHCVVRNVDFTMSLENLAYHLGKSQ